MTAEAEIEEFLRDFKAKLEIWGVVFEERQKNLATLLTLEMSKPDRKKYLTRLTCQDFCEGPISSGVNDPNLWVFGTTISNHEIYIKISLGYLNMNTICVSFHVSEYPMTYPFKKQ